MPRPVLGPFPPRTPNDRLSPGARADTPRAFPLEKLEDLLLLHQDLERRTLIARNAVTVSWSAWARASWVAEMTCWATVVIDSRTLVGETPAIFA